MLLPFQASLVDTILAPSSDRIIFLRAGPGLGKSTALVSAVVRLMDREGTARVLILCPAVLRAQWAEKIKRQGARSIVVDRYKYREMFEAAGSRGELWPAGTALILSEEFSKQADIQESLAGVSWSLIIADETLRSPGLRAILLEGIALKAKRIVLVTIEPAGLPDEVPLDGVTIVDWQRDQLLDRKGRQSHLAPFVEEIRVEKTQQEQSLSELIESLCQLLERDRPGYRIFLTKALHSSPSALERILMRFSEETGHKISPFDQSEGEIEVFGRIDPGLTAEVRIIARKALAALEAVQSDSKLESLANLLEKLARERTPNEKICVLTSYVSTLYYLAAELELRGIPSMLLHGSMGGDTQREAWQRFEDGDSVLLATNVVTNEGLDLSKVTNLILYDLPRNKIALLQTIGRFDSVGRVRRLSIYVFRSDDSQDLTQLQLLSSLHDIVEGNRN